MLMARERKNMLWPVYVSWKMAEKKTADNDAIMKPVSYSVLKKSIDYRFPELLFTFNEDMDKGCLIS